MNWLRKAKAAFQRLKSSSVKHQEVKQWGINIVKRLFEIVGVDEGRCPKRRVEYSEEYRRALVVEMRVPYCEPEDITKMNRAVRVLAQEAIERTPVETGRLRDSQYTLVFTEDSGKTVVGAVGYDLAEVRRFRVSGQNRTGGWKSTIGSGVIEPVFYALAVHNRDAKHDTPPNPPRASWRFLEFAARDGSIRRQIQELFE